PVAGQFLTQSRSNGLLATLVVLLGLYNAAFGLLPEALANRHLEGMRQLVRHAAPADLVISPAGVTGAVYEFYLGRPPAFANLNVRSLARRHPGHPSRAQAELRDRTAEALRRGRRVWVYDLLGEGHVKQQGFPWAHLSEHYGPETFLSVIEAFRTEAVVPPSPASVGLYRLRFPAEAASRPFSVAPLGVALSLE